MTPRELAAASSAVFGEVRAAPSRGALAALMQTYPDFEDCPDNEDEFQ